MVWASESALIAGTVDHQLKIYDIERAQAQSTIFTNHKVATSLGVNFSNQN